MPLVLLVLFVLLAELAALVLLGAGRRGGARPPSPICMLVLLAALVLLAELAALVLLGAELALDTNFWRTPDAGGSKWP